jgi:hypothetical protein
MCNKLLKKKKYAAVLIDPYNSLKIDMPVGYKLSSHDYHYEALSEIQLWTKQNCSIFINIHPHSNAGRETIEVQLDDNSKVKLQAAPQKGDGEGGAKNSNKADDFLVIHRYTQHPTDWMFTEIHVRKIKEIETGGKPTFINKPVRLKMNLNQCGFIDEDGVDAILNYHNTLPIQQEFKPLLENNSFLEEKWENDSQVY